MQSVGKRRDVFTQGVARQPLCRDALIVIERAGGLTTDRRGRVRVVTGVRCRDNRIPEVCGCVECPQCGFKALHDMARAPYFIRALSAVVASRDDRDSICKRWPIGIS